MGQGQGGQWQGLLGPVASGGLDRRHAGDPSGTRQSRGPHFQSLAWQKGRSGMHPILGPRPAARPHPTCHVLLAYFPWSSCVTYV